jgi:hypothetical protein
VTRERQLALALGLGGALGALGFVLTLEPVVGLGVFAVGLFAYWLWNAPVRHVFLGLMVLGLVVESPHERPFGGEWRTPWVVLSEVIYNNLHHLVPLPFLRLSGMELVLLLLVALVLVRKAWHLGIDPAPMPSAGVLRQAMLVSFATLLLLEVWGVARGGDVKQSLFQMRTMLFTSLTVYLGLYALRGPQDVLVVGRIIVGAAIYRALLGAYFLYVVAHPAGIQPPYVTTHTDTVLFALAIVFVVARWWEEPTPRRLLELGGVTAFVFLGMYLNDRRLAYVTLMGCLAALFMLSPWNRARRFITRVAIATMPLILAYVVVGWNSEASIFKPVQAIRTVVAPEQGGSSADASTEFRIQENFNLVQTWRAHPVVGSGFGHEYDEVILLPDISRFMPDYRYQPHNGILWLLGIGGVLGFSGMFLYLAVAVFLAARAYHAAVRPSERAVMLVGLSAVIAYLNQVYGDMGTQSYTSVWTLAPLVALVGQVAMSSGAWKEHTGAPRATHAGATA